MSVAGLFNLRLDDARVVMRFGFDNAGEHIKIQKAIFDKFNVNLTLLPIDPIPLFDLADWARRHQAMHSDANRILGLQGNDLTALDPTRQEDVTVWCEMHAREHIAFAQVLGLT